MLVIIDGHNLLWSVYKDSHEFDLSTELQLCRLISRYLRATGDKGQIVFDGRGPAEKDFFGSVADLEVVFAGVATDADTVIENKISASSAPRDLTIVSSDRRIIKAARAAKATALKSEEFWGMLKGRLARKQKNEEPPEKQRGLDQAQTQKWLEFFGLDD